MTPDYRPTAEMCLDHAFFNNQKEALLSSLAINKNHDLISNMFKHNVSLLESTPHPKEFDSFIYGPHYYALLGSLSNAGQISESNSNNIR